MRKILFLFVFMLLGVQAYAQTEIEVNGIKYSISGTEATVVPSSYSGDIVIHEAVMYEETSYSVTTIGASAFFRCGNLTSVSIPNSVTNIEAYAFASTGLTFISIPNSVESIGASAFSGSPLTSITIPNSVESIGGWAFYGCNSLNSIIVDDDNPSYSSENGILFDKTKEVLIQYPLGRQAAEYAVPGSVKSIGDQAFYNCSSLTSVTIPNSVESIGEAAFAGCTGLTTAAIGNGITSIGDWAFLNCVGLTEITVLAQTPPAASSYTFDGVDTSIPVYITGAKTDYEAAGGWEDFTNYIEPTSIDESDIRWIIIGGTLYITGTGDMPDFGFDGAPWYDYNSSITAIEIAEGITKIGKSAFQHCRDLASVSIPNSVTSIGDYAFITCSGLTSINIPNSVESIGEEAFAGCVGLTILSIPNSVESIGVNAFRGCTGLTTVSIGAGVTNIEIGVFVHCSSLSSITVAEDNPSYSSEDGILFDKEKEVLIQYPPGRQDTEYTVPGSVESIEIQAFIECVLTSVTIPNSVASIGDEAFAGCASLASVAIGNGVISIGEAAFAECLVLTSVTIPNSVTSIGDAAFAGCSGLTSVAIGSGVISIGEAAFAECPILTSVTIPNSVTSIGDGAFAGCTGLTEITVLAQTPPAAYSDTFGGVDTSIPLYVLKGTKADYEEADGWKDFTNIIELADDAALSNLEISQGVLSPAFSAAVTNYEATVGNEVETIEITAVANHANATVTGDTGTQALTVGANTFTITVTAEDRTTTEDYTIVVTREDNVGIYDINTIELTLYPNPVSDVLYIKSPVAVQRVVLYDINGSMVLSNNQNPERLSINVSELLEGMYMVKLITVQGEVERKIMKK